MALTQKELVYQLIPLINLGFISKQVTRKIEKIMVHLSSAKIVTIFV